MSAQDRRRAFPSAAIDDDHGGMSFREYVAAQALPGIIMDRASWGVSHEMNAADFAKAAVAVADALITELAKEPTDG